VPMEQG